jgi:branched-chain amino acid transport system permease protein
VTGLYKPDGGEISFAGENLVGLRADQIASKGIARTFQTLRIFANMTVLENVLVGMHSRLSSGIIVSVARLPLVRAEEEKARREAIEILSFFGGRLVGPRINHLALTLSYANRRRLEICRALAARPRLLLLDEPAAGMNPKETLEIMGQIRQIRDMGHTVVLIEHDMKVVMGASDRVVAMDHGEKIAEGSPHEVAENSLVIEAYLGRKESGAQA